MPEDTKVYITLENSDQRLVVDGSMTLLQQLLFAVQPKQQDSQPTQAPAKCQASEAQR